GGGGDGRRSERQGSGAIDRGGESGRRGAGSRAREATTRSLVPRSLPPGPSSLARTTPRSRLRRHVTAGAVKPCTSHFHRTLEHRSVSPLFATRLGLHRTVRA